MDSSSSGKSNKIRDIVRLQQILKKWKKVANNKSSSSSSSTTTTKSIKFLKKTLSFSESSTSSSSSALPKGYMAVCVGKEEKRFVIPTEHLSHQLFAILLREAEEEFGFQQEGLLKFPCQVHLFEKILRMMEDNNNNNNKISRPSNLTSSQSSPSLIMLHHDHDHDHDHDDHDLITSSSSNYHSPDQLTAHPHPQTCR